MEAVANCFGALALELTPGSRPERAVLGQDAASALAALVARDLARFDDHAADFDLGRLDGAFESVELLRPGWPLHREPNRWFAGAGGGPAAR